MPSPANEDCARKRIAWIAARLRGSCGVGEARFGYVPSEEVISYRELVRLQKPLTEEVTRYKNEIHALLIVLFPEFCQVFADPSKPTALAMRNRLSK